VVRDITERKRIEKIKEEVDSIIQHDLKSPLAGVIVLMRNMLEDNNLTSRQKEHLQLMFASEQRMLEMVKQSSALSQIEQGVYVGSTEEPCDVWKLIQEAVALHQPLAAEKGVELDLTAHGFERAEPEGVMVQGEEQLAYFVLSNVVRNAIEASPEHRAVTIRLEQKQGIDLRVHNEGAVPEGIRDRFFDKYVTCSRNKGTGLGTYSAKRMAEAQGWEISMRTSHEEGTTIILDIPKGS
jgi:signal transduction histidine kinase